MAAARLVALLVLGATVLAWFGGRLRLDGRVLGPGIATSGILAIVFFFGLARWAGVAAAVADARFQRQHDFPAYPRVEILAATDKPGQIDEIATSGCARLLMVGETHLFFIRPVRNAPGLRLSTFGVRLENIAAVRINDNYTSCE